MRSPVTQRLLDAAAALPAGPVSLRALAQAHGPSAPGSLLLLLAAPCLLAVPGAGTVLGLGMSALAAAMWRGDPTQCLPERVAEVEMPRAWAQRVLRLLASTYAVGFGLVFRDGVAIVLGFATAGLALLLTVGMVSMVVVWGGDWVTRWKST